MPSHKTSFCRKWLEDDNYKAWLRAVPSSKAKARCAICTKDFDISNMGEAALRSHMGSAKHKDLAKQASGSVSLAFPRMKAPPEDPQSAGAGREQCLNIVPEADGTALGLGQAGQGSAVAGVATPVTSDMRVHVKLAEQVSRAEILWTLKIIMSHYSFRSSDGMGDLLRLMMPDSDIAAKFMCGAKKSTYLSVFGIAPHFLTLLQKRINSSTAFVLLFDESLNKELCQKQLDVHVRYWEGSMVMTRYLHSVFMGHATAEDLKEKIATDINKLVSLGKMLQLSMDGPNVNMKLLRILSKDLEARVSPDFRLIDIGSCGLHTVHNAFKLGHTASGWDLGHFFSSLTWLLKDTPARREDFTSVTGCQTFPLEHCAHRWVENVRVAERALAIWPHVKTFIRHLEKGKGLKTASFEYLAAATRDELLEAKLENFVSVAKLVEPFLRKYQSEAPLIPFLAQDLHQTLFSILERFVKPDILGTCHSPADLLGLKLDDDKICLAPNSVDVGFKAKKLLRAGDKLSPKSILGFRIEAREFLKGVAKKMAERSPLQSKLVRNLQWLNPQVLKNDADKAVKQFEVTATCLVNSNHLKADDFDSLKLSFKMWLAEGPDLEFDQGQQRLDVFYYNLLNSQPQYQELWRIIQLLLTLSHGQAQVERGFSINRESSTTNLADRTLISKRIIYDHVSSVGGIDKVELTPALLMAASGARAKYQEHLEQEKEEEEKQSRKRKREDGFEELEKMKEKKARLEKEATMLEDKADKLADKAEGTHSFKLIVESNALRKSAKEKKRGVEELADAITLKVKELGGL